MLICTSSPSYASLYVKGYDDDDDDEEYDKNSGDTSIIEKDHLGDRSPEKDFC